MLQETHSSVKYERIWQNEWGGKTHGQSNARGVVKITKTFRDQEGRVFVCQLEINDATYTIVNFYAPNEDDPGFFIQLFGNLSNFNLERLILAEDLNLVLNMENDKRFINYNNERAAQVLNELMNHFFLADPWGVKNPELFKFTWKRAAPSLSFAQLDFFFIPQGLMIDVAKVEIMPSFRSDHSGADPGFDQGGGPRS